MKVIELTCPNQGKHDIGMLLTKKERSILFDALDEYQKKYKRRKTAAKLYKYMYRNLPL